MPLYEYQCDSCGARFELIRKFSDPPLAACPTCGKEGVRKLVSSPAFQFKGSGWYATDYSKKSSDSSASTKAAAESTADAKSDAKGEAGASGKAEAGKDSGGAADKPAASSAAPAAPGKDK
jgi:putative FmdB family regulatory protein